MGDDPEIATLEDLLDFIGRCKKGKGYGSPNVETEILPFVERHAPHLLKEAKKRKKNKTDLCTFLKTTVEDHIRLQYTNGPPLLANLHFGGGGFAAQAPESIKTKSKKSSAKGSKTGSTKGLAKVKGKASPKSKKTSGASAKKAGQSNAKASVKPPAKKREKSSVKSSSSGVKTLKSVNPKQKANDNAPEKKAGKLPPGIAAAAAAAMAAAKAKQKKEQERKEAERVEEERREAERVRQEAERQREEDRKRYEQEEKERQMQQRNARVGAFNEELKKRGVRFLAWDYDKTAIGAATEVEFDDLEVNMLALRTKISPDFAAVAQQPQWFSRQGWASARDDHENMQRLPGLDDDEFHGKPIGPFLFGGGALVAAVTQDVLKTQPTWPMAAWDSARYIRVDLPSPLQPTNKVEQLTFLSRWMQYEPKEILLIDDKFQNCKLAALAGFQALFHKPGPGKEEMSEGFELDPLLHTWMTPFQEFREDIAVFLARPSPDLFSKNKVDHGIDKKQLEKWINAHPPYYVDAARLFSTKIRYVTYKQWYDVLKNMVNAWCSSISNQSDPVVPLKQQTDPNHTLTKVVKKTKEGRPLKKVSIWLPSLVDQAKSLCKSNFWVTQLAARLILNHCPHMLTEVVSDPADARNHNVLLLDDGSYSGTQIYNLMADARDPHSKIRSLLVQNEIKLSILVPYVSRKAKKTILTDLPTNVNLVQEPYQQIIEEWTEMTDPSDHQIIEDMLTPERVRNARLAEKPPSKDPKFATYFEFKMPDQLSVAEAIRMGFVWLNSGGIFVPFILGCEDIIREYKLCPVGNYKKASKKCRAVLRAVQSEEALTWGAYYADEINRWKNGLPSTYDGGGVALHV